MAANPGEVVVLPLAVPHVHPWAVSEQGAHLRQTLLLQEPDAHTLELLEQFVETVYALGQRHQLGRNGVPTNPLQTIVTLQAIQPAVYVAGLPVALQRSLFVVLAAVGRLLGYRAFLPAHSSWQAR